MTASVIGITPELHPELHPEIHPELSNHLDAKVRDISFKFSDHMDINCCYGCCKPREWTDRNVVYINHDGEIEPFLRLRKKVLYPRKEHEKSFRRMREYIQKKLQAQEQNVPFLLGQIERTAGVDFERSIAKHDRLTLHTVKKINNALKQYNLNSPK